MGAALAVFGASSGRAFAELVTEHSISDSWVGPGYFVDYSGGFVRRGLPGEAIRLVWGHSQLSSEVVGWTLTRLTVLAVAAIALQAADAALSTTARCLSALLVVVSPLSITTILRDPGRYDGLGVIVMALLLGPARRQGISPRYVAWAATVGVAIAVLSEELLFLFLAPVVAAVLYRVVSEREGKAIAPAQSIRRVARLAGLALIPGAVVAVASIAATPSHGYLDAVQNEADSHSKLNAAWALGLSLREEIDFVTSYGSRYVVGTGALWLVIYSISIAGFAVLTRRGGLPYWASGIYFGLAPIALSVVGVNARRWWTLAFLSHVATTTGGFAAGPASARAQRRGAVVVAIAFLVAIYGQSLGKTVLHPTDIGGSDYASGFVPFWLRGAAP